MNHSYLKLQNWKLNTPSSIIIPLCIYTLNTNYSNFILIMLMDFRSKCGFKWVEQHHFISESLDPRTTWKHNKEKWEFGGNRRHKQRKLETRDHQLINPNARPPLLVRIKQGIGVHIIRTPASTSSLDHACIWCMCMCMFLCVSVHLFAYVCQLM